MKTTKKYPNNYTLAGAAAFMYNVDLYQFFDISNNKKTYSQYSTLSDIGFEWKGSSQSQWTSVSVRNEMTSSDGYIKNLNYINNGSSSDINMGDKYKCVRYSPLGDKIYPIRIMIMGLSPSTTYNIRSYYVLNGVKTTYNEYSVTTLGNKSTVNFSTPQCDSAVTANVSEEELSAYLDKVEEACSQAKQVFEMFYNNYNKTITIKVEYDQNGGAARAGTGIEQIVFNGFYRTESIEGMRSVVIHELGHVLMNIDTPKSKQAYKDKKTKFMEFATDCPYADWKWLGKHCYPIISSNRYSFIDDCVVVSAYNLSKQINDD